MWFFVRLFVFKTLKGFASKAGDTRRSWGCRPAVSRRCASSPLQQRGWHLPPAACGSQGTGAVAVGVARVSPPPELLVPAARHPAVHRVRPSICPSVRPSGGVWAGSREPLGEEHPMGVAKEHVGRGSGLGIPWQPQRTQVSGKSQSRPRRGGGTKGLIAAEVLLSPSGC